MAHILYISYDGMTDPLGQSQVLPYLKGLCQKGHHFTLISFEKPERFQKYKADIEALIKGFSIEWIPLSYTAKPPIISTVYDIIRMIRLGKKLVPNRNIELVHCRSYITAFAGLALKKQMGIKFLFDIRGFWPDERIESGIWNVKNPLFKLIYRFFKHKERTFFKHADTIISLTHKAEAEINTWKYLESTSRKVSVIPTCVDLNLFNKSAINIQLQAELKQSLKIDDNTVVITYLGTLGNWNLLEEMLAFFRACQQQFTKVKFLIFTHTSESYITERANAFGIFSNNLFITEIQRSQIPTYLSLTTFSVFFVKPCFSQKASAPTKLGELMAMGIPVIVNSGYGDVSGIVIESKCGIVIHDFNEESYFDAITKIRNMTFDKESIIRKANDYFSLEKGVEKYNQVYLKLLNTSSS